MNVSTTPSRPRPDPDTSGPGGSGIANAGRLGNAHVGHGNVSFGTEAALCRAAAIPAIICGPGHTAQAHPSNEWVTFDPLAQCEAFMRRRAGRICVS